MSEPHLVDLVEVCEQAARAGGEVLVEWRGQFRAREKGPTDLVTDADLASEAIIREVIRSRYADHAFIGEESASDGARAADGEFVWITDPLDGTTNYVHGYPSYAVSVAVARGSELLAGAIFDPNTNDAFAAARGGGAWRNGVQLSTSDTHSIAEALVAVSLPAKVQRDSPDLVDFVDIVEVCRAIRRSGSAALNLAYVASGQLDAFWATHIHPWDVAAGVLLIREAGGVVTGRNGAEFDLWNPHFIASSGEELQAALIAKMQPRDNL